MGKSLKTIQDIQKEHPIASEYESDARYTWPKRWKAVQRELRITEQAIMEITRDYYSEMDRADRADETSRVLAAELERCNAIIREFIYNENHGE